LAAAAKLMWDGDCGFLPVVDAAGTVAGVLTDRDICMATATRRLLPEHISAAQVMTSPVHACLEDDTLGDVLEVMKKSQVRRLPVIDANGRLRGVISMNDIVLARPAVPAKDIVSALAGICAHRHLEAAGV
jgi:CBS domain-containing protein